jgi:Tol biopolymer transport system component
MDQAQFQTIRRIFEDALQKDVALREQFLIEACGGNEDLQREVNCLLIAHEAADSWIDREGESIIRAHSVTFKSGTKIGSYEIIELLGVGGMGEVYRARDASLPSRQVAIKVIPETFSSDPERVARFELEAQVLASLSHPHIGAIHHVVESNGSRLLILELVEGVTLANRLMEGPIALPEALAYAKQIAEALDYAHDKGIVHRDLKPANIKITPDDQIKVLDFGIAKVRDDPGTNLKDSPTVSVTAPARLMGTAAYMSPEQATGKEADRRSDIWAFGCVLYEMLTGNPAFAGETVSEILAEVLKSEPDFRALPSSTPQSIRRLLRRCLQKDRKRRQRHIGDARLEIEDAENGVQDPTAAVKISRRDWLSRAAAAAIGAAGIGAVGWLATRPREPRIRFAEYALQQFPTLDPVSIAISPDGTRIVFVATEGIESQLCLLEPGRGSVRKLEGTEGAYLPFWSPDNQRFGFFAKSGLHVGRIDGGLPQKLASVSMGRGGTWSGKNEILYSANPGTWISQVDVESRRYEKVTQLEPGHVSHRFPQFLNDSHFLFYVTGKPDVRGVWVYDMANRKGQRLQLEEPNEAVETAMFAPPDMLLFLIKLTTEDSRVLRRLFVQEFSLSGMTLVGRRALVQAVNEPVMMNTAIYRAGLSVAEGCLSYRTGSASGQRQLEWRGEKGELIETVGAPDPWGPLNPSLSPDGRAMVLDRTNPETGNTDIFRLDVQLRGRNSSSVREPWQLTREDKPDYSPVWSRRREAIVFSNNESGAWNLYEMSARGGHRTLILETEESKFASDWSRNDKYILYRSINPEGGYDLRVVRYFDKPPRQEFHILPKGRRFDERDGQFSPDTKWVAYSSNEFNDQLEIFVLLFPEDLTGGNDDRGVQVSLRGGTQPRWGRQNPAGHSGSTELYYLDLKGYMMRALVSTGSDGQPVVVDRSELFRTGVPPENPVGAYAQQYAVFEEDGKVRFLLNEPKIENPPPLHLIVDIDWKSRR